MTDEMKQGGGVIGVYQYKAKITKVVDAEKKAY